MRYSLTRWCSLTGLSVVLLTLVAAHTVSAQRIAPPEILPRSAWQAKPANKALMKAQSPREIVIHHTGEKQQLQQTLQYKLQKLQKFSQATGSVEKVPKPAWGDVPYHYYVDATGRIGEGRNIKFAGDSNTKYDTANRIQIVVEGHFDQEQPSAAQLASLDRLVLWLAAHYKVPAAKISGHSDHVGSTDCPGQGLKSHLPSLRARVTEAAPVR